MAFLITQFFTQIDNSIPDRMTTEAADINVYQQIKQAVIDYSRVKADVVAIDLAGDGGRYYAINSTNFPGWSDGFSQIISIEYPAQAIANDAVPVYLEPEDWDTEYYDSAGVRYLYLPNHAPAAADMLRIQFSSAYAWVVSTTAVSVTQTSHGFSANDYVYQDGTGTWVNAGSTANILATHQVSAVGSPSTFTAKVLAVDIPELDFFAVCNRAACILCTEIATRYSRTSDSTISADSVNHTSRAGEFSKRAKEFCEKWEMHLGIGAYADKGSVGAAGKFVKFETEPGWPSGRSWMFHRGR